jgi:hypothetical protein
LCRFVFGRGCCGAGSGAGGLLATVPIVFLSAVPVIFLSAVPAGAVPPDPQRPFIARTCDAALARLDEARQGSPLISAAEMAEIVIQARVRARQLCGGTPEALRRINISGPPAPGLVTPKPAPNFRTEKQ